MKNPQFSLSFHSPAVSTKGCDPSSGGGSVTDTEYAEHLFGGRDTLVDFVKQTNEDTVMDEANFDWRLRDDSAKEIMARITQCSTNSEFQQLEKPVRNEYLRKMYVERMSMGQISRLTGLSKSVVFRAVQGIAPRTVDEKLELHEAEATGFAIENEVIW